MAWKRAAKVWVRFTAQHHPVGVTRLVSEARAWERYAIEKKTGDYIVAFVREK